MKFKEKLACREIEGEAYIVDISSETLHSLNETGTLVWNGLRKGLTPEACAERLAREFEVAPEAALADVRELVARLTARGLVKEGK